MKSKLFLFLSILLAAGLLAACGPSTVYTQALPPQRTITVTGTGTVTLTPDIAYVSIGVHSTDASASAAMADNNAKAAAVIAVIQAAGIQAKDIQTTNFSVYPQPVYDDNYNQVGVTYAVNNTVYVTVRDLTKLGEMLDATVQAGANNLGSISFDVADKTEALSQARLAAVENARAQADELTSATDVSLGDVQTISYYDSSAPLTVQYPRAEMAAADNVPIQSGSLQISTTVTIVYEIK